MIARGDIRWFRFGAPDKRRPVLVLGRPDVLPSLSQVPVIPLSTHARGLSWEVVLTQADGVPSPCVAKPEWSFSDLHTGEDRLTGPRESEPQACHVRARQKTADDATVFARDGRSL